MKSGTYVKLQKKYGGMWVATSENATKVYASAKKVEDLFSKLKDKKISPEKTVIGYISQYAKTSIYLSLSN